MKKLILYLTREYHLKIWQPFIQILLRYKSGRVIHDWIRLFFHVLWVFNITAPPKGEASCFTFIFLRYPNKFNKLTFTEKIIHLKRFISSLNF